MESAMTVILCDASEKMHHGILFDSTLINEQVSVKKKNNEHANSEMKRRLQSKLQMFKFCFVSLLRFIPQTLLCNLDNV